MESPSRYVNDQLECKQLCLGMDEEHSESLWVRTEGRAAQVTLSWWSDTDS